MDYKKKYENALSYIKDLIEHNVISIESAGKYFPELIDSDEKIRQEIIDYIKIGTYKKDWIAWLEKQSERPTPINIDKMVYKYGNTKEDCTNGLPVNCQIRAYRQGIIDTLNLVSNLEKQGESTGINPSEFDLRLNKLLKQFETLPKEELANSLSFYLNVVQNNGTYKPEKQGQNEQILDNSAKTCNANKKELGQSQVTKTSDQDEMAIDIATKAFNHNIANDSYCKENCKGYQETGKCYADWDCEAKRKAEQNLDWSEEDEERYKSCLKRLGTGNKEQPDTINTVWLKSLKERLL